MGIFVKKKNNGSSTSHAKNNRILFTEAEPLVQRKKFFDKMDAGDSGTANQVDTIISEDVTHKGDIAAQGLTTVEGKIEGNLHCIDVCIMENAEISGAIVAKNVTISGVVFGNIYALTVRIKAGAKVTGDIFHQALAMEPKAIFEGASQRVKDPFKNAPLPEGARR